MTATELPEAFVFTALAGDTLPDLDGCRLSLRRIRIAAR
jgi:hypothetical protein